MFYRIKEIFMRFMYGRYGSDALNNFLLWLYIGLTCVNLLAGSYIIYLFATAIVILIFFRMLSRNTTARAKENHSFLNIKNKVFYFLRERKKRFSERKTHIYRKCPSCKATLRLPRKKGKHTCNCPKCHKSFNLRVF